MIHSPCSFKYGAAVQAAVITGNAKGKADEVLLLDVTPLTLGISTQGDVMAVSLSLFLYIPFPITSRSSLLLVYLPSHVSILTVSLSSPSSTETLRCLLPERRFSLPPMITSPL